MNSRPDTDKKYFLMFMGFMTLITIFRLFYINTINLCFDEAYYWEWSQKLSVNYYSQPGLVAWWIKAFALIGGDSQFFVRLPAVVASFISGALIFALAGSITGSGLIAFLSAVTFQIIPLGTAGSILITYDIIIMPFWILALFYLWKVISTRKGSYWYLWAVFFAFSVMGKLSSLVMLFCVAMLFLISKEQRQWLAKKEFYFSLALAFVLVSPNIIWNFSHNFVNYRHVFKHAGNLTLKPFEGTVEFLGSQLLLISPVIFILIIASAVFSIGRYIKSREDRYAFLIATSVAPLFLFLLQTMRAKVEGNWANIVYPAGFILLFIYLSEVKWKKSVKIVLLGVSFAFAIFISTLILYPSNLKALGVVVKPENDRANEVYGWDTVGKELAVILKELPAGVFVFGINHQTPGIVRFYTEGHPRIYCLPYELRKTNQYDIWDDWETLKGKDGLLVIFEPMAEDIKTSLEKAFESVELYKSIPVYRKEYGATPIRTVNLYLCRKFKGKEFTAKPKWY